MKKTTTDYKQQTIFNKQQQQHINIKYHFMSFVCHLTVVPIICSLIEQETISWIESLAKIQCDLKKWSGDWKDFFNLLKMESSAILT